MDHGEAARPCVLLLPGHEAHHVGRRRQGRRQLLVQGVEVDVANGEAVACVLIHSHIGILARLVVMGLHKQEPIAVLRHQRHGIVPSYGVVALREGAILARRAVEVEHHLHQVHIERGTTGEQQLHIHRSTSHDGEHAGIYI